MLEREKTRIEMSAPIEQLEIKVEDFGILKGNIFEGGIKQFMGIPYGRLLKRWTRATLETQWKNNYHDGTVLGPCTPVPLFGGLEEGDILTPVRQFEHYKSEFKIDEKNSLVLNIATPSTGGDLPVFVFIHGGSWMYGTSNLSIFDGVKLVRKSIQLGKPIIVVTFNYRCGISGFLASQSIEKELKEDGFSGNGNFGLTDQVLALEWVYNYIHLFGGNKEEITICGESAGSCSVSNHIFSKVNPKFKRAIAMSGLSGTIPAFSKEWHERQFRQLLKYYDIENDEDALDKLRAIPEAEMAKDTHKIQGTSWATTGNPCIDGWYLEENLNFTKFTELPNWLDSLMIGDTKDEGIMFYESYEGLDYKKLTDYFGQFVTKNVSEAIFSFYEINLDSSVEDINMRMAKLMGDFAFVLPNYELALKNVESKVKIYPYHFDEPSTLENVLKGKAYHAIDLLYLFGNGEDMTNSQQCLVFEFMTYFINFIGGEEPWEKFSKRKASMRFGPNASHLSCGRMLTLNEDETTRQYSRLDDIRQITKADLEKFFMALDYLTNERQVN